MGLCCTCDETAKIGGYSLHKQAGSCLFRGLRWFALMRSGGLLLEGKTPMLQGRRALLTAGGGLVRRLAERPEMQAGLSIWRTPPEVE